MTRLITLFCAVMAAVSGLFLYTKKQQTSALDQKIAQIVVQTERTRDQTAMLRAEWTMLNQPDRLHVLAERYAPALHPVAPTQFVQLANLSGHLPPVGAAPVAPVNPRAEMGVSLAADHVTAAAAEGATQHAHAPVMLAQAVVPHAPTVPAPVRHATTPRVETVAQHPDRPEHEAAHALPDRAPSHAVEHAPSVMAENEAPASHASATVRAAHVATPGHDVMLASNRVAPYHYHPAHEVSDAAWHPDTVSSVRSGGSSLANSRTSALPPPVPVSN
ncbi:cell division protein FtsL [Novacetimonas pomaceti]|uniref:ABC transporter permease n=1 Tax=Novacetimonas pomaceti TaxID=2021998 RepID=A0ABX5P4V1_9PROT|nr:ABC transporter permease [Novacetimonas pomaceti]PYD47823.1 ABC transporter permease [Novacetimonas pomaceti]